MKSFGLRAPGLTIDLGTSNTRIYVPGRGVVASDPSLVAVRRDGPGEGQVVAVGAAASQMLGRLPRDVSIVHPIKSGVIADFESTETLLRALTRARRIRRGLLRPGS